ncbi:MAG: PulJ/GspJ family protein [Stellaceae bacterium]
MPRSAGFTLLEVVVALAIAGLALVGLFEAGSGGLFAVDTAARAEEAVERARSHLAAIGRNAAMTQGESQGDDGGGFHWKIRVQPLASRTMPTPDGAASMAIALYAVEVDITWEEKGKQQAVVLKTLRLGSATQSG